MCIPNFSKSIYVKRAEEGADPEGGTLSTVCFGAVGLNDCYLGCDLQIGKVNV